MFEPIALPFIVALILSLGAGNVLIPLLRKLKAKQVISTDAPKSHLAKGGTPTMGGVIILVGVFLTALLVSQRATPLSWAVLLTTFAFGLIGFLDDFLIVQRGKNLGLRAREKLALQFAVAIVFAGWMLLFSTGIFAPEQAKDGKRLLLFGYHVLLMVGLSNAVNLTDGLDGLAAGVSLPVWTALALLGTAWTANDWALVGFCAAFAGATLGYLWYNAHPAQVFMGDTGSLAIGGGMAAVAIGLQLEWIVLVAALVHLVEAASVTLQVISFKTTGKRIFKMSPLHHHFELCEWPETRIVARFAIASSLCAAAALAIYLRR